MGSGKIFLLYVIGFTPRFNFVIPCEGLWFWRLSIHRKP